MLLSRRRIRKHRAGRQVEGLVIITLLGFFAIAFSNAMHLVRDLELSWWWLPLIAVGFFLCYLLVFSLIIGIGIAIILYFEKRKQRH
jgi:predicted Na+-dependent transporter